MKLHTVFITYNRLELTKRAIESYLETVSVPFAVVVADNGSTDGTQEWLQEWSNSSDLPAGSGVLLFRENHYPGYATNRGWAQRLEGSAGYLPESHLPATHLHRADNDFEFLPGWCEAVEHEFQNVLVGQVGLRTDEEEAFNEINVGGNCVIARELWDKNLRWDERPWPKYDTGWSEDALLSPLVVRMGYLWTRVQRPCIVPLADVDWNDNYYQRSMGDRGLTPENLLPGN